jgi:FlaA1/EpsC-like NDP-sugar epimerase
VVASRSPRVASDLVALLDAGAIVVGALIATALSAPAMTEGPRWAAVVQGALISAALFHWFQRAEGRYELPRLERGPIDGVALLAALLLALFAVVGLGSPFALSDAKLVAWYSVWVAACFPALLAVRYGARARLSRLAQAGAFDTRVAIYGGGRIAERLAEHLGPAGNGVTLVGVYDDRVGGDRPPLAGPPVNGSLADLVAVGRREEIDQIIIALPPAADRRTA